MSDHESTLLSFIDQVLSGAIEFDKFSRDYYAYYIDKLPKGALSDNHRSFFYAAQEKLDWTAEGIDDEAHGYGWMTPAEYMTWLRDARNSYRVSE